MSFQKMILEYVFKHNKTSEIFMFKIISKNSYNKINYDIFRS